MARPAMVSYNRVLSRLQVPPVLLSAYISSHGSRTLSSSVTRLSSSQPVQIRPRPVDRLHTSDPLLTDPDHLLSYIRRSPSESTKPFVIPADPNHHRHVDLIRLLRPASDRLVEIEVGRYDRDVGHGRADGGELGGFDRMEMRLGNYLDWLEKIGNEGGEVNVGGRQVYLAQWRALDDVPELKAHMHPPASLSQHMSSKTVDLYQSSFFIGPTDSTTPLHHDPYHNIFNLLSASSSTHQQAKHFIIFPPSCSPILRSDPGRTMQRNTSPVDLILESDHHRMTFAQGSPSQAHSERLSEQGLYCVLREGKSLYIPKGWWHRVQNVVLDSDGQGGGGGVGEGKGKGRNGWTAGVGWWFLPK